MLGARLFLLLLLLLSGTGALNARATLAAKHIIVTVLFGIDLRRPSPCIAARITLSAEDSADLRKERFTSGGALGWFNSIEYVDRSVCVTKIST